MKDGQRVSRYNQAAIRGARECGQARSISPVSLTPIGNNSILSVAAADWIAP
jgi:hypothetical protein